MKKTFVAALIGIFLSTLCALAQNKNQDAAEIAAVIKGNGSAFTADQVAAMNAAVAKLNGEGSLTSAQEQTLRTVIATARKHEAGASGTEKQDAKKFADALEKALGGSLATPTPVVSKVVVTLTPPTKATREGEDPAAPKINADHAEHLLFSAKIAGQEVVVAGEDAALYKTAAENAAKLLKGEVTTLSELDAVILQECGSQIRLSGVGSETKQKLNNAQLLAAINAALQKGGYQLVAGSTPAPAPAPAPTPTSAAPASAPNPPTSGEGGGASAPGASPTQPQVGNAIPVPTPQAPVVPRRVAKLPPAPIRPKGAE